MAIFLIGEPDTKRCRYFLQAAEEQKVAVDVLSWKEWNPDAIEGGIVKIDPPSYNEYDILELPAGIDRYKKQLNQLTEVNNVRFLNHPAGILQALDKWESKLLCKKKGMAVTDVLGKNPKDLPALLAIMKEHRVRSVFLKPSYGSGAAGILALSLHPRTGEMAAYTAACLAEGKLLQQKAIRCLRKQEEIEALVNTILQLETVVEKWYPKAEYHAQKYDFRVVWQFGKIAYILPRKSPMPITNLHLNNRASSIEEIFSSMEQKEGEKILAQIEILCQQTMELFPALTVAGLDIMLDKKTNCPRLIEINGQGDLLYQDIYGENRIYGQQVAYLKGLEEQEIR